MATRPRRSCLTVPPSSAKMLAKAAGLPADEVVVDLEDGVAPVDKDAARERLGEATAHDLQAIDGPYADLRDLSDGGLGACSRR
jgi:citrate lyase subunit beta / citryl-CoA lyase